MHMLPQIAKSAQFSRNRGRGDHKLQEPPQKKHYHKSQFQTMGLKFSTALKSHSSYIIDSKALHKLICPSMNWSRGEKINVLTLPSAPSSTPSSPSTISVDTETPPEGCRCFCPSIFRSLKAGKKEHYHKMQGQLPMVNTNQYHQVRVLV